MTIIPELTPGQRRTAAARAARTRQADERAAARLRAAGYCVVPARGLDVLRGTMSDREIQSEFVQGFVAGVEAVREVSDTLQGVDGG